MMVMILAACGGNDEGTNTSSEGNDGAEDKQVIGFSQPTYTFSKKRADGYYNSYVANYGDPSYTFIFRPEWITYHADDVFDVVVTGLTLNESTEQEILSFRTTFFEVES